MDMAPCDEIRGLEEIDRIIEIDQSPIGRTPRSNPATYTGLFGPLRELFAEVPESRTRGYDAGRFSFNVKGGRCEACQGDGLIKVEMHFLPDVYVPCDVCKGQRYNRETLEIRWRGKNIHEVLDMNVEDALRLFQNVPGVGSRLQTLMDVGLSYLQLGQSATTLSGGEAQRVKLARELAKRATGRTLYILDEPTTGLHFHDVAQLLDVLHRLRDEGNTIVVIEHNLDVIKTADWIIDLGPEGGAGGGSIVASGTPEEVARAHRLLHRAIPAAAVGKFLTFPKADAPRSAHEPCRPGNPSQSAERSHAPGLSGVAPPRRLGFHSGRRHHEHPVRAPHNPRRAALRSTFGVRRARIQHRRDLHRQRRNAPHSQLRDR